MGCERVPVRCWNVEVLEVLEVLECWHVKVGWQRGRVRKGLERGENKKDK